MREAHRLTLVTPLDPAVHRFCPVNPRADPISAIIVPLSSGRGRVCCSLCYDARVAGTLSDSALAAYGYMCLSVSESLCKKRTTSRGGLELALSYKTASFQLAPPGDEIPHLFADEPQSHVPPSKTPRITMDDFHSSASRSSSPAWHGASNPS